MPAIFPWQREFDHICHINFLTSPVSFVILYCWFTLDPVLWSSNSSNVAHPRLQEPINSQPSIFLSWLISFLSSIVLLSLSYHETTENTVSLSSLGSNDQRGKVLFTVCSWFSTNKCMCRLKCVCVLLWKEIYRAYEEKWKCWRWTSALTETDTTCTWAELWYWYFLSKQDPDEGENMHGYDHRSFMYFTQN